VPGTPAEVTTVARWFGPEERPLLGWLTLPNDRLPKSAVLMAAPIGYEWWSSHRTLRTVAERLAAAGHAVLRFDYAGTGDSAGGGRDGGQLAAWRGSVATAAAELRSLGAGRLTLLGTRFGALLALSEGAAVEADAVVTWASPASGKRFARELRMFSDPVPDEEGALAAAGWYFGSEDVAEISAFDPKLIERAPAPRVTMVGAAPGPLVEHLRGLGAEVGTVEAAGGESALEEPTEDATVPAEVVDALLAAVGPGEAEAAAPAASPERPEATFAWDGGEIRERVVRLGPEGLVGVLSTPVDGPGRAIVVWLNSGSEPHIGPGRAWVEYSRTLARHGDAALRLDFSGWGESPDLGRAPGRPYDDHGIADTVEAVDALEGLGYERIVLAGLCSGAWIALRAILGRRVAGVVALNPQIYWEPGFPVIARVQEGREKRLPMREREERGAKYGLWSVLDLLGHRDWGARWLDQIAASGVPVLFLFAERDEGLEYLEIRQPRRLSRTTGPERIEVVEVPDIDHSMHRFWLRGRIVEEVEGFLNRLP
jgi:dienelactone hydrolase